MSKKLPVHPITAKRKYQDAIHKAFRATGLSYDAYDAATRVANETHAEAVNRASVASQGIMKPAQLQSQVAWDAIMEPAEIAYRATMDAALETLAKDVIEYRRTIEYRQQPI